MPNSILDAIKLNSTTYDINDKRIADADITSWNGKLSSVPIASAQAVGGIMVGTGLSIDANGVLSATGGGSYVLPAATTTTLGGIIVGSGLSIDASGVLSATGGGSYTLPPATTTTLGGVIVGSNINVAADGTISVAAPYDLPIANSATLGGVKIGSNITIEADGTISVAAPYVLPVADSATLGGVKIGSRLTMDNNGVLSADEQVTSAEKGTWNNKANVIVENNSLVISSGNYLISNVSSTVIGALLALADDAVYTNNNLTSYRNILQSWYDSVSTPTPNYVEVGTPTINSNYVLSSGIVRSNVLFPMSGSWKIRAKIRTASTITTTAHNIIRTYDATGAAKMAILIQYYKYGNVNYLKPWITSDGTSWDNTATNNVNLSGVQTNTDYYLEFIYNGSDTYTLNTSTDGVNWTSTSSAATSSTVFDGNDVYIGFSTSDDSVYLKECKLYSNNALIWSAVLFN